VGRGLRCVCDEVQFNLAGDLGSCVLSLYVETSEDLPTSEDLSRGACTLPAASCYPASYQISTTGSVTVPFSSLAYGSPDSNVDVTAVTAVQWQLVPAAGINPVLGSSAASESCSANITVSDVSFY